jgi:hypothetical protein
VYDPAVRWRRFYVVSFGMSVLWIGFITHWMVDWCVRIGCILNIPAVVMGRGAHSSPSQLNTSRFQPKIHPLTPTKRPSSNP